MRTLIIAQYFPPDMGGGATRAYNVARGLSRAGCDVTVVTAFPHYPSGKIPKKYRFKLLAIENENNIKIVRTFVPPIASKGFANRMLLFLAFAFSSLFALFSVGKIDVVWAANPNIISVFPSLIYKLANQCPLVQNVDDLWPETLYDLGLNNKSL
jgi:colanic acid biosynthesis glycosyl transferase WcaI